MAGGTVNDKLDSILNEVENRLKTDVRMPGSSSGVSITSIEVRRGERFTNIHDSWPVAYIEHGEVVEDEESTRSNRFDFRVNIQVFVRERDPEKGLEDIKNYVASIRRIFRETTDDKHLVVGGSALARHVATPKWSWGVFQPLADDKGWEFGGIVVLEITFSLPD